MFVKLDETATREQRAFRRFRAAVEELLKANAPATVQELADGLLSKTKSVPQGADLKAHLLEDYEALNKTLFDI